ncbi:hypothetical protein NW762_000082 [Fusarium torreyae]|uniref:DUF7918 domain-containing protein n=1 Tax=Fusarium torreyae TaxID=1237075 RepID=A0A9W8SIL8_9HYPO|nr:hypothetical protein NW762_000082 [Fusarium torreyae]
MAVLEEVPHVMVRVRVAGELATEHDNMDDQPVVPCPDEPDVELPAKHCYIESKSGAEFSIEVTASSSFRIPRGYNRIRATVYVDGIRMRSRLFGKHPFPDMLPISSVKFPPKANNDPPVLKNFVFTPITRIDDASAEKVTNDIARAKHIGQIMVIISKVKVHGHSSWSPGDIQNKPNAQEFELAEKAMKGRELSHATSLVESSERANTSFTNVVAKSKLGAFIFDYRSHEALQHEMIIPRSPSLEPASSASPGEDDLSHLSESEIRRLARERLRDTQTKNEPPRVKREADWTPRTPRQWKIVKLDDGKNAFDLTNE